MKKVILGVGMLISGVIGFVGIIIAFISQGGFVNGTWLKLIEIAGLAVPFVFLIILAVSD